MADASAARTRAVFEFKSATLPLIAVILKTADLDLLAVALDAQLADSPDFFEQEPVVIDLSLLQDDGEAADMTSTRGAAARLRPCDAVARRQRCAERAARRPACRRRNAVAPAARAGACGGLHEGRDRAEYRCRPAARWSAQPLRSAEGCSGGGDDVIVPAVVLRAEGHRGRQHPCVRPLRGRRLPGRAATPRRASIAPDSSAAVAIGASTARPKCAAAKCGQNARFAVTAKSGDRPYEHTPSLRALRVASPTPCRGQHQQPGKAGSAVFWQDSAAPEQLPWRMTGAQADQQPIST